MINGGELENIHKYPIYEHTFIQCAKANISGPYATLCTYKQVRMLADNVYVSGVGKVPF